MKSKILQETKTFAEGIRAEVLNGLSLEPEVVQKLAKEGTDLRRELNYRKSPPLEKLMIEQVVVAHAQNMVALHNLETIPINADIPFQKRYLEGRVTATQSRLIKAVCILAGLRRIGRQHESVAEAPCQPAFQPGMRPPQQFTQRELKGCPVDYLDEDDSKGDLKHRNAAIRLYWAEREARWQAYAETAEDLKPRRLVKVIYRGNSVRQTDYTRNPYPLKESIQNWELPAE